MIEEKTSERSASSESGKVYNGGTKDSFHQVRRMDALARYLHNPKFRDSVMTAVLCDPIENRLIIGFNTDYKKGEKLRQENEEHYKKRLESLYNISRLHGQKFKKELDRLALEILKENHGSYDKIRVDKDKIGKFKDEEKKFLDLQSLDNTPDTKGSDKAALIKIKKDIRKLRKSINKKNDDTNARGPHNHRNFPPYVVEAISNCNFEIAPNYITSSETDILVGKSHKDEVGRIHGELACVQALVNKIKMRTEGDNELPPLFIGGTKLACAACHKEYVQYMKEDQLDLYWRGTHGKAFIIKNGENKYYTWISPRLCGIEEIKSYQAVSEKLDEETNEYNVLKNKWKNAKKGLKDSVDSKEKEKLQAEYQRKKAGKQKTERKLKTVATSIRVRVSNHIHSFFRNEKPDEVTHTDKGQTAELAAEDSDSEVGENDCSGALSCDI